jgi:transposase
MARAPTALKCHLQPLELRERYRRWRVLKEARRWHALWLLSHGHRAAQVAETLGRSPAWVRHVRQCSNTRGPEAVLEGHQRNPGGRRLRLSVPQQRQLSNRLTRPPQDGGVWTGAKVAAWREQGTGQKTYPQLGCPYLHRVGLSPQVPRRRHAQAASPEQQEAFKKSFDVR